MDYHTPGVYIREVDSGPKPIASVSTSIPGFIGLFDHNPEPDAVAITGTDGARQLTAKVDVDLVDVKGNIASAKSEDAAVALTQAFRLKPRNVKDLSKLLELNGHKVKVGKGGTGKTKITSASDSKVNLEVSAKVLDAGGKVITGNDQAVEDLLNTVHATFAVDKPKAKTAKDLLEVYGVTFQNSAGSSLSDEYSISPVSVTNKSEFFRWVQSFYAEYVLSTKSVEEILGESFDDPDEAADAVFEALASDDTLKESFRNWLSQPSVFNFVQAVNGFYDNGGGKSYVYMMGTQNMDGSLRENQADKIGLYAFDDCEDMSLMVAPGLNPVQQKEMLEMCELRKDRFAILDGPIVSDGEMDIPASDKGYGAIYVPWFRVTRPSWYTGDQSHIKVTGPNRRKLLKSNKMEVYVPPSGHMAGVFSRVDGDRGVHKAPANELVMGITGLTQSINRLEQERYNFRGVNVVRDFKDRGIRIWGARTLATMSDASWKYINVRRLFIMVEQSIMLGSQWSVFEPNDETLWKKLTRDVRAYLMRVWRSGALFGSNADEAFYVKCDTETNPRYLIDAGQVNVHVGMCPVKPAEFVIFSIGQWDGGALIDE
jgi:hypothetical protein